MHKLLYTIHLHKDYDLQCFLFVDRLTVVVCQIVSRKTRKYLNPSKERSERVSTKSTQTAETVNDIRVLVSFYAAGEDGNVIREPVHKERFCVPVSTSSKVVSKT